VMYFVVFTKLTMVVDGETGLLVPPKNYEAMANAILKLLTDNELARRLGKCGLNRLTTTFTINRFNREITEVLVELLDRPN